MTLTIDKSSLLPDLPKGVRDPLFGCFNQITRNFREKRWEPSELNGGKLCEIIYTILKGHVDGAIPPSPLKPRNMTEACRALEQRPSTIKRSIRVQIPRMLIALYDIRNNRGVGHVDAEVSPNHMDAIAVLYMSKWLMAEIIRLFHAVDIDTATYTVEALMERTLPLVWQVGTKTRILNTRLSAQAKTLALLYHAQAGVQDSDLFSWVEHSNLSVYRRDVLRKLHQKRLVEYDEPTKLVTISPTGMRHVEELIDLEC